jgi:hypothetical protein
VAHVERNGSPHRLESAESGEAGGWAVLEIAGFLLAFGAYLYLIGWITNWARLSAARLPIDVVAALPAGRILGDGLRSTALTGLAFAVLCLLAYLTSAQRWEADGQDWHDIIQDRGIRKARTENAGESEARHAAADRRLRLRREHTLERVKAAAILRRGNREAPSPPKEVPKPRRPTDTAPIGERGVRIIAGFNVLLLSAVVASAATVGVDEFLTHAWWATVPCWILVFLGVRLALARWGPLQWGPYLQGAVWFAIAAFALFASAPLGVLVLVGVGISTLGRKFARLDQPRSMRDWVRSPLAWVLLAILALLGLAYQAIPPVSFTGAVVTSLGGEDQSGGYLGRGDGGVYLAVCRQRANATSTDERVQFIPSSSVRTIVLGDRPQVFDSRERPSLATLALKALGLKDSVPTLVSADLRPRRAPCLGGSSSSAPTGPEASLGLGALYGSGPAGGQAHDGELPIARTSPGWVSTLAREYQPTLAVSVADRFWPVSVGALLADRGPAGEPTCLIQSRGPRRLCNPSLTSLGGTGSVSSDYLQFPVHLIPDPSPGLQFEAFERGQGIQPGSPEHWLPNPRLLNPWYTAQIYFYYAGALEPSKWPKAAQDPGLPAKVLTLEYWFYYQYNYFPLGVRSNLMQDAPLAADLSNVDFHQGDWEHIDVLLDPTTHAPLWLYMARHSDEGVFVPWASASLAPGGTHPVVQAAFGGHPSYPPICSQERRPKTAYSLSDWLVCGPRFVFTASGTPLVDIAWTPWACWRGHFGEAIPGVEVSNARKSESILDSLTHQVWVAGPPSPLWQAENTGACNRDPREPELKAP